MFATLTTRPRTKLTVRRVRLSLGGSPIPALVAACLAIAALSLLLPSQPTYDPWAWIVWGRELALLKLNTTGGPSWKPLPSLIDLVFAPSSKISDGLPPALWLVVARAGGLLALVFAYRLAARLVGRQASWVKVVAGLLAVIGVALTPRFARYIAHGNEVPMAILFLFAAIDRHLEGKRVQALVLGALLTLLRPEAGPFFALYAVYVGWREPGRRLLAGGVLLGVVALWTVPTWISAGHFFGAIDQAHHRVAWSLARRPDPWLQALRRVNGLAGPPIEIGALAAVVFAALRKERATLWLAGLVGVWLALFVGMTQAGFTGNARYFIAPLAIVCLLAAVGAAQLIALPPVWPLRVVMAALLALGAYSYVHRRADLMQRQIRGADKIVRLHKDLETAVQRAGGPNAIARYGVPTVNRGFASHLAWVLKQPIHHVELGHGQAVVFEAKTSGAGVPAELRVPGRRVRTLARVGAWDVYLRRPLREPGSSP